MFGIIISNYKELQMFFFFLQGQKVLLKGDNPIPFQTIRWSSSKAYLIAILR